MTPVNLEGQRSTLVPLTLAHMDRLCAIGLDPRLWQATTIQIQSREQMSSYIRAALDAQSAGTALPFVIVERNSGQIVGTTRYHSFAPDHRRVEIGFTWIAPPWQRTVINTESKYLLLRHAFEELSCIRVEFKSNAGNEQSRRALLRIGAKEEGTLRSYRISTSGQVFDMTVFSITSAEWPQVRTNLEGQLKRATPTEAEIRSDPPHR
jgi:RimJ/RimL family protein N-acetyltransferase